MAAAARSKTPAQSTARSKPGGEQAPEREAAHAGPYGDMARLQRLAGNRAVGALFARASPSPLPNEAQPLEPSLRASMDARFQSDFRQVRIHAGEGAAALARSRGASAYTQGQNIVFGRGQFAPHEAAGRSLLAHELAHVVQQSRPAGQQPGPAHEQEAEAAALTPTTAPFPIALATAPGSIQCAPESAKKDDNTGAKETVVQVHWSDDSWDFEDRVVSAVARGRGFRGVPKSSLPQVLNPAAASLHGDLQHRHFKPGQRVSIRVSASYDPGAIPELSNVMVAIAEDAPKGDASQRAAPAKPAAGTPPATDQTSGRNPSLKDQEATVLRTLSRLAAEADRNEWSGLAFTVTNNGKALMPAAVEKLKPQQPRPSGMAELSQQAAAAELQNFMDIVAQSEGEWQGKFARDEKSGAMHFKSWSRTAGPKPPAPRPGPPPRQRSQAEEFEQETGMVYPQRINKQLHDVGAQGLKEANPFSLKNLPYTIAGVVIPIGAMKVLTTDMNLGTVVRIEWGIEEDVAELGETQAVRTSGTPGPASPGSTPPLRELRVGDVIETPQGTQAVVEIKPGKIVTKPVQKVPPGPAPEPQTIGVRDEPLPEGTNKVSRTLKPRTASLSDEQVLRANMEAAGRPVAKGHAAHHIVLKKGGGRWGDQARTALKNVELDINDADNGIALPASSRTRPRGGVPEPEGGPTHNTIHTENYSKEIAKRLEGVTSKREARLVLQGIAEDIRNGTIRNYPLDTDE